MGFRLRASGFGLRLSASVTLTVVISLLFLGCRANPTRNAETLMAQGDYAGALSLLDSMKSGDSRMVALRMKALLVEGQGGEGWRIALTADTARTEIALRMIEAAEVIVREKNRALEAILIMDSSAAYDPELKAKALDIAWQRGLEYLAVPGDAGYQLMRFAARLDTSALKRLRTSNPPFAIRYEEIDRTYAIMRILYDSAVSPITNGEVMGKSRRIFTTLEELPLLPEQMVRTGWRLKIEPIAGTYRIVADAEPKNPNGVIAGTRLVVP